MVMIIAITANTTNKIMIHKHFFRRALLWTNEQTERNDKRNATNVQTCMNAKHARESAEQLCK